MTAAARWPARSGPANSQFERPIAISRIWFSTQLLSAGEVRHRWARERAQRFRLVNRLDRRRALWHQHLLQQARGGKALVDDARRHGRLNQGLAICADPFAANVALHREHARLIVQLLGHVLADALELAASGGGVRLVVDLAPGQVPR